MKTTHANDKQNNPPQTPIITVVDTISYPGNGKHNLNIIIIDGPSVRGLKKQQPPNRCFIIILPRRGNSGWEGCTSVLNFSFDSLIIRGPPICEGGLEVHNTRANTTWRRSCRDVHEHIANHKTTEQISHNIAQHRATSHTIA